ncbi:VanW family protein [Bacillus sp. Cr_A10]|uniref:VanW family protein n=1 Tax=Bacillus sp. Cr_A10 TaxID=3033993 RepID=UPI0023DA166F|nr:VanW family protein [Bacillus sp. Cr_A10]MDF2067457.1 VanW family protein [Bacillus sp. Cr_A10]
MNRWIALLIILCSIGLAGCLDKSVNEEVETNNLEQKQQLEEEQKEPNNNNEVEEQETKPLVVNIMDPNTSRIIRTVSPKDLGYEDDLETYKKEIEKLAYELARGTETEAGYDKRMVLDKIDENGQVIKGSPRIILKEDELVDRIIEASSTGEDVDIPLYVTESSYDVKDIPHLEDVLIASYTTYFDASDVNRNKNIEISARAINDVIVGSGDYFSFNELTGPRDKANGYQPAPEIINKKLVMGIGGGVCQTSSTLFNVVDQLSVTYVERNHHSLDVGYVPKGRDATVSYGTLDFRFQNTSGAPFLIKAIFGSDFLTIEVRTSEEYREMLE